MEDGRGINEKLRSIFGDEKMRCALTCWMPALLSAKMATIAGGYFPPKYYMDFVTPIVVPDFGSLLVSPPYLPVVPVRPG